MNPPTIPSRRWRHKSVISLMAEAGNDDPEVIVRQKARELVAKAMAMGWSGPPFDPLILASLRGIQSRQSSQLFTAEAQLIPMDGNQLLLEFNPDRPSGRRNYTIGHEIAHTFFDDCYEMVHQRTSGKLTSDPKDEIEYLCQVAAAEMVMPKTEFLSELKKYPRSLSALFPLCDTFDVSREAAARRLLDLKIKNGALVFLSKRLKPVELKLPPEKREKLEPKFRVLYTVPGKDFEQFIPKHKSVSDDSCIYNLTSLDDVESACEEDWSIPALGACKVEAIQLPVAGTNNGSPESPTIVALLEPLDG